MESFELETQKPLDPPVGKRLKILAPWGVYENCNVVGMRTFAGTEYYAFVEKPISNPGVSASVFKIKA